MIYIYIVIFNTDSFNLPSPILDLIWNMSLSSGIRLKSSFVSLLSSPNQHKKQQLSKIMQTYKMCKGNQWEGIYKCKFYLLRSYIYYIIYIYSIYTDIHIVHNI